MTCIGTRAGRRPLRRIDRRHSRPRGRHAGAPTRSDVLCRTRRAESSPTEERLNIMQDDDHKDIREGVRKLCERFPGEYWRKLDAARAYPAEFVQALTDAGYLATLIPEEYGGIGLNLSAAAAVLEEVQHAGCNGAACHAQMYVMGTVLRHGNAQQKQRYLPDYRRRQIADAGVRRHRAGERHRHQVDPHFRQEERRPLRRQRPEGLDQPGRVFRPDGAARPHDAPRRCRRSRRMACRFSSSTCAKPRATASPSGRSGR